jgi:hypothetical protein
MTSRLLICAPTGNRLGWLVSLAALVGCAVPQAASASASRWRAHGLTASCRRRTLHACGGLQAQADELQFGAFGQAGDEGDFSGAGFSH